MADITSNLVSHYKLDETTGTTAADSGSLGDDGVYDESAANTTTAGPGQSLLLAYAADGASKITSIPSQSDISYAGTLTISLWAKATDPSVADYQPLVEIGGSTTGTCIHLLSDAVYGVETRSASRKNVSTTFADTNWHHVVLKIADTAMTLYLDGSSVDTATHGTAFSAAGASPGVICGVDSPSGASFFDKNAVGTELFTGSICDVRFYLRDLADEDVLALYALGASSGGNPELSSPTSGITFPWPFHPWF